jgi:hypothetical protein
LYSTICLSKLIIHEEFNPYNRSSEAAIDGGGDGQHSFKRVN